jgi:alpha-L-rhamnosidase
MGLLEAADWRAEWIGLEEPAAPSAATAAADGDGRRVLWPTRLAARQLRREFTIRGPLRQATVYVAGLGCHELWLNGDRVGDHVATPP